jgi:hypothetical protein
MPAESASGKVEWSNTGKHAIGAEHIGVALHRGDPAHRPDEAVGVFHLLAVVVDQIGRLFGVAHGLQPALSQPRGLISAAS